RRELQVPEEFIGKPVKCPSCGLNFVTSKQNESQPLPRMGEVVPPPISPPVLISSTIPADVGRARVFVLPPAICMLLLAVLGFGIDVFQVVYLGTFDPQDISRDAEGMPPALREWYEQQMQQAANPAVRKAAMGFAGLMSVFNIVIFLGSIQMIRLRMWG